MRIERRISTPTPTAPNETEAQPPPEQPSEPTPAPTSSPTEATARDARLISANEPGSAQLRMRLDEQLSNTIDTRADITKEMVEQQVPQDLRAQVNDVLSRRSGDALERDAALVRDALASENNRDAALRTFVELSRLEDLDARDDKERITPEIKQALVHAVAGSKSDHPGGEEGILDERSAIAAAERLRQLPQSQYDRVKGLLDGRSETEQSLILKKMMAHRDLNDAAMKEIEAFAGQIEGVDEQELIRRTSPLDLDADGEDQALRQAIVDSCGPTTILMLRAEKDPAYAMRLRDDPEFAKSEQQKLIDAYRQFGGPVGAGISMEALHKLLQRKVDPSYSPHAFNADRVFDHASGGQNVPITVNYDAGGGHVMLVTDARGQGADRRLLVSDPFSGKTLWISAADLSSGAFLGQFGLPAGRLTNYFST